jgi:hypothetical protein
VPGPVCCMISRKVRRVGRKGMKVDLGAWPLPPPTQKSGHRGPDEQRNLLLPSTHRGP